MTIGEFQVTGMSCAHCESAIRSEVSRIPGVAAVEVRASEGLLRVESEGPIPTAAVIAAVDEAGYAAVER